MGSGGLLQLGSPYCEVSLGAAPGQPPRWVTGWRQNTEDWGRAITWCSRKTGLAAVPVAQGSKPEARLDRVNEAVPGIFQGPGRSSML